MWDNLTPALLPLSKPQCPHLENGAFYLYPDEIKDAKDLTHRRHAAVLEASLGRRSSIYKGRKQWPRLSSQS